jgi:hypothetical protein
MHSARRARARSCLSGRAGRRGRRPNFNPNGHEQRRNRTKQRKGVGLASRSELSVQNLQRILTALHAALVIQPEEDLAERVSPERGAQALAAAAAR